MRGDAWLPRLQQYVKRRDTHRAIGTFGVAQAVVAGSAVLRLPLISKAIGNDGLGLVFIAGAVIPLLFVVAAGLRSGTRLLCAEQSGARGSAAAAPVRHEGLRLAWRLAIVVGAIGAVLCLVLPLQQWFGASGVASEGEVRLLFLETVLVSALAYPGACWWGALEAEGFVAVGNLLVSLVTIGGLAVTVILAILHGGVAAFGLVNVATSAGPFMALAVVGRMSLKMGDAPSRAPQQRSVVRLAVTAYSLRAVGEVATRGVDPLIVGSALGPADSAVFGVAQRLSQGITVVPTAVAPILTTRVAQHRGRGGADGESRLPGEVRRQFLLSSALSVGFVALGPLLAPLLGAGASGPVMLYVALAATSVLWSIQIPIAAAASSPRALRLGMPVSVASGVSNVILSVLLVRSVGIAGPVWASALTVGATNVFWLVMIRRDSSLVNRRHFG